MSSLNLQTETSCAYKVVESIYIFMRKISKMLLPLGNPLDGVNSHPRLPRTESFLGKLDFEIEHGHVLGKWR